MADRRLLLISLFFVFLLLPSVQLENSVTLPETFDLDFGNIYSCSQITTRTVKFDWGYTYPASQTIKLTFNNIQTEPILTRMYVLSNIANSKFYSVINNPNAPNDLTIYLTITYDLDSYNNFTEAFDSGHLSFSVDVSPASFSSSTWYNQLISFVYFVFTDILPNLGTYFSIYLLLILMGCLMAAFALVETQNWSLESYKAAFQPLFDLLLRLWDTGVAVAGVIATAIGAVIP